MPSIGNVGRLGGKGDSMLEISATYPTEPVAVDPDLDFDPEDDKPPTSVGTERAAAR